MAFLAVLYRDDYFPRSRGHRRQKSHPASSDVDILVSFERPIGFLTFLKLENHLASLLGAKVDLVSRKALKPASGRRILSEVRFVA